MSEQSSGGVAMIDYPANNEGLVRRSQQNQELDADDTIKEARKVLGYMAEDEPRTIDNVLAGIGVSPFTTASVTAYKDRTRRANALLENMIPMYIFVAIGCAITALAALLTHIGPVNEYETGVRIVKIFGSLTTVLVGAIAFFAYRRKQLMPPGVSLRSLLLQEGYWVTVAIKDTKNPVPEFALQTAMDYVKAVQSSPDLRYYKTSVHVEEYYLRDVQPADPFLVVSLTSPDGRLTDSRHVEVWNEPKYKQERYA